MQKPLWKRHQFHQQVVRQPLPRRRPRRCRDLWRIALQRRKTWLGAEPGPDTALAGSNPLMPTHVSEAMERLAKTYYGKELPQSEETAVPGTACKRPAAAKGRPRKRPAAAMPTASAEAVDCSKPVASADKAALMRRPAASCHSDKQRGPMKSMKTAVAAVKKKPAAASAAAAKTRCITRKQQLKWRPEGCARCRRTPGCCPSCWVKRGYEVA